MTSSTVNNEKNEEKNGSSFTNGNGNHNSSNGYSSSLNGSNNSINLNLNPLSRIDESNSNSGMYIFVGPVFK